MKTLILMASSILLLFVCIQNKPEKTFSANYISIQQDTLLTASMKRGKVVYEDFCMQCHMETGEGIPGTFPPLAQADFLLENRVKAIKAVKYGLKGEVKVNGAIYTSIMAPLGLYDDEVADVMNYILNSWNNTSSKMVTEKEVAQIEK
ncbi:c-type cytochrome [Leeuwenhoekiella aestuarii]|nr:cytochrome c [Leeuwenhoekiella aestuarii]